MGISLSGPNPRHKSMLATFWCIYLFLLVDGSLLLARSAIQLVSVSLYEAPGLILARVMNNSIKKLFVSYLDYQGYICISIVNFET